MQDIHNCIPENHHLKAYNFTALPWSKYVLHEMLFPMINLLSFHISTFRSVCAVPNMAVFFCNLLLLLDFSLLASAGKHSPILWYVIKRNRLDDLICNLKNFLQLNMFQELQIFAVACTYLDAGYYYYYYYYYYCWISHFSASTGKHSPILGYVISRNRLGGLICNLKSFL